MMNTRLLPFLVAIVLLMATLYSCEETYNNPLDPEVEDVEPQPPTALQFQVFADSLVRLTWSARFNYGFEISKNGLNIGTVEPTPEQVSGGNFVFNDNSNFDVNQAYTYVVNTLLPNGSRAGASTEVTVTFDGPTGFSANVRNDTTIVLSWTDNSAYEEGYEIKRITTGESQQTLGTMQANSTQFTDNGPLLVGRTYTYEVVAFTERENTASDTVSTSFDFAAPTELLVSQVAENTLRLEWTDNSAVETGYIIERKVDAGNFEQVSILDAGVVNYEDTFTFANGAEIAYNVSAITNYNRSSAANNTIEIVFAAPSNISGSYNQETGFIDVTWEDNTSYETAFVVERSANDGDFSEISRTEANATSFSDSGPFEEGTLYRYRVRAAATTLESDVVSTQQIATPPAAPSNFEITVVSDSQIQLTWADNSNFESGYQISGRTDSTAAFQTLTNTQAGVTSATLNISLTNFYRFMYRVVTIGEGINSFFAEIDSTFIIPRPTLSTVEHIADNSVRINWNALDFPVTGYNVYSTDNFDIQTQLGTAGSSESSLVVTTLQTFRDYEIQITALFGGIETARSPARALKRVIKDADIALTVNTGVGNLNAVKRSKVNNKLIVGGSNGWEVWSIPTNYINPSRLGGGSSGVNITAVAGAEEFAQLVAGDENGNVYLINDNNYSISSTISDHTAAITSLYLGFADELITGSADSTMRIYNAQRVFTGVSGNQGAPVYDISRETVGSQVFIVAQAAFVNFYRYTNNYELGSRAYGRSPQGQSKTFTSWGVDQILLVANSTGGIFLLKNTSVTSTINLAAYEPRISGALNLHDGKVVALEFLGGRSFISASETGKMQLWDIDQPTASDITDPLMELTHPDGPISDGTDFPGSGFVSAHTNGKLNFWRTNLEWRFVD